jgi:hypothetical protein
VTVTRRGISFFDAMCSVLSDPRAFFSSASLESARTGGFVLLAAVGGLP